MGSIDAPDWLKDKMKKNISSKNSGGDLNVMPAPDFLKKKDEAGNVLNGSSASALEIPSTSLNDQFLNWNGRNKKGQLLANFKNDPNWKPAPEQVKPVGSKPAEKSIFDLPDNVIFTPNLLDSQELEEYNQKAASTPIPQLPNKTQIVKDIIASRQNDAVMRERAKKFLVNDAAKMDLKVDAENFPKVEEYFNDKKNIVQNEIQGLLGDLEDLGVAWGENLYLNPDAQKKMKRISELDGYLGELKKYSNIFIREQAVRDIKPTDYDNYSDYLKAIGRKVNSVNNYEGIKKKEEAILNKTDDTRSKQITDNENYNFELAGIEALQDNIIANFKAGNIDEEAARSEMSKLYISNQTLESRYPEAALDNLRKYLGDYIAQKRKDNDGNLKQTWHNVIYAAPSSKEIITAIHDLRANDQVEISEEQEKLLAADPDKIPLTSMLGHIYKNTILKGAQTLNSMVGIDNEERKLEFRDPTMYLPVQPGEIPMPVAVGEKNIVRMQPNPAAGQHADVLSWATANSFSDVAGTIASYVRLNKVFGVVANKLLGGLAGAETTGMAVTAAGELKPITALTAAQTNLARNILSSTYLNYYDKLEASKDLTDNTTAQKAYALSSSIITGLVFAEINPGKILSGITGAEEKAMGQKFIDKLMQGKGNIEPEKMKSFFAELAMNTAKNLGHNMSLVKANQIADIALDKLTNKNALENRDVMDEMFGSLPADIISFLPFSAVAGYKQAKGNIGIRNAIRMAMTDPVRFENDMLTNVQTGKISPEDAAQKMAYVKGLLKVYRGNDLNTEKLLSLTPEQRFEYANNLLEENGINHKIKGMTDDLQIAAEREKIAVLQERRKTLLNGQQEPAGTNATNTPGESIQSPGSQATKSETTESVQQTPETPESKVAKDLLTTDKPVFTDFDGTVFKDGKLTPIGEELKAKIARGEDVTVLTARKGTEENLNFISEQLGISKEKIKAGLSPEGKASHLTPDAVFIDNDAKNRQAAEKVGIKAIDPNMRMVDAATPDEITIGEMVDRTGTYKGERGHFFQDGQSVVFKVDGKNKEYELGNIEEVKNEPISSFGIVNEQSVVNVNDAGNVEVRGKEYVNHFSDPVAAINYDKEGNIQSVNLETTDGKKRTFRGNIAEDIAYQIHLQKITKDNETASRFEEYINTPDVAKNINERLSEVAQEGPTGDNGQVQPAERTKVEPLSAEGLFEQRKSEGKLGVFKDMPAEEGVKMIAEQAQDIDSKGVQGDRVKEAYDATVNQFGEQLVKAAVQKYPAAASDKAVLPTIEKFADRIASGEKMTSPEDLQFYENNKAEIEKILSAKAEQSGSAKPVEETTTEKKKPSAEGSVLLSHSGLQDIADDFGLSDVTSRDYKSDEKLAEEAATLSRQWHDEGTYAENIDRLINNIFSGRGSNDVEKTILQQHIANVRAEASKLDVYSKAYDEKLKELERLKNAGAALKSTAAATLRDTTVFSDADPTMADWMAERKTVLEVDELTNGQKKEIQDIWNEYETNLKTADEKVYQAEQLIDQLKAELAVKNARGQRKYLRSKNLESLKAERGKIVSSIQDKLKKIRGESNVTVVPYAKELFAIAPDVSKLVTNLIDTGVTKLSDIVDNIHATLVDSIPGITKRDVHNLVAGDYNQKKPTLTELQFLKKDIIEQAKLMNKLEKLQNGEPVGTEKQQRTRIKEITDLRNQIKEYRKYDQSSRTPEQILNAIKKRNEARQKEIEEKIANKDFSTQPKKPPLDQNKLLKQANPELWKETMDAIMAKEEAGHKFELLKRKDELEKRPPLKKYVVDPVGKVITTAKAIKAGIDDSVTMVQLMMAVYSNPGAGMKAKLEAFKDINNTRFKRQLAALHNSVYWDLIKKSELDITEPQSFGKKEVEELFSGNLLDDKFRIPFTDKKVNPWTYTGGMFERIFTSMGNNLRLNLFYKRIAMLEAQGKTFESHPEEYKGAARAINELTARGKMPKNIQASMDAISPIIWAPKMLASTFNTLGITDVAAAFRGKKGVYRSIPPQQARYLAWQMGKGIGLGIGVMAALAMRGWGVDKDPRSNTFGNVTSPDGNTKYNVFGRFSSLVKNIVQIGWGTRVESSGTVTDIDKTMGGRLQSLYKFTRGKMTPAAGLFSDYWLNKKVNTFTKQPISLEPGALAKDMLLPISLTDVKSSLEQDGSIALLTRFLPALEGIQVTDRRDYKTISSSLPDRAKKYLSDRNIAEPFFNPKQIEIKQMKKGVGEIKKLSDFDEETQKKYENTHSRIFDQELARLKSSFVFKDEYGNISLNSDNSKDKKIWVKDLDEKGLKKFIGIVNGKATAKTKEILFKEYKK